MRIGAGIANFALAGVLLTAGSMHRAVAQQIPSGSDLEIEHVQAGVYMIAGAGGNIVVQTGPEGVLVVDTGTAGMTDKIMAAIRKLSDDPVNYIINTSAEPDHTGNNDAISRAAGANMTDTAARDTADNNGAQILAQDNVLQRMAAPGSKIASGNWPTLTFVHGRNQLSFNDEPVEIIHQPAAHSDGDSFVFFRHSDVIAAGDIMLTTTYPVIDLEHGGSIQGELDALNNLIDMCVPHFEEEGGTYVVPGHGRIVDRFEVVEYRDMVTIIRDRIRAAMAKGMTLDQIKNAGLTLDYDYRYGAKTGPATTDNFVTTVYKSLSAGKTK